MFLVVYTPFRAFLPNIMALHPPAVPPPGGLHPPVGRNNFFSFFFRYEKTDFLKHAHMEFITRLGQFFFRDFSGTFFGGGTHFRDFFGNFFFGGLPPCSPPWGTTPLQPPWGTTPPCRARFFSQFFSQKYFFLLKNRHMGDFFGRLEKKYFSTFLWFRPLGDPFWDPPLDPLLTPFGTHFGPFWTHFGPFWSLWVTIEAINRSQMASRCLK